MTQIHCNRPDQALGAIGIGLKHQHAETLLEIDRGPDFLELHAENYMNAGGPAQERLQALARRYPLSVHGVGMSLGSAEGIDTRHLERLRQLVDTLRPILVSEHLAWSRLDGHSYNDLLPVPLTEESLNLLCANIDCVQQSLGRRILVENPSLYVCLDGINTIREVDFLNLIVERTGCGLLFDVNNAFISASNLGRDLGNYLADIPWHAIGEWHLAGHSLDEQASPPLYIDDHGSPVSDVVWRLYRQVIRMAPEVPTLIEWDNNVPALDRWLQEAELARRERCGVFGERESRSIALRAL
ncbi:DUF692 domain-containing protein [Halomonas huangheensis]|nr:DUF692 domain-containing protein [Halomonas huangheensis]